MGPHMHCLSLVETKAHPLPTSRRSSRRLVSKPKLRKSRLCSASSEEDLSTSWSPEDSLSSPAWEVPHQLPHPLPPLLQSRRRRRKKLRTSTWVVSSEETMTNTDQLTSANAHSIS